MDPLFDPAWTQVISQLSVYFDYALIAILLISFVAACAAIGSSAVPPPKEDEAKGDGKKDSP